MEKIEWRVGLFPLKCPPRATDNLHLWIPLDQLEETGKDHWWDLVCDTNGLDSWVLVSLASAGQSPVVA